MFDSKQELLDKIRLGEDSLLEFKSVHFRGNKVAAPKRSDLADELAAFANSGDGVLLLGIDDKTREIDGIPREKLDIVEDYIRAICYDSIEPTLSLKIVRLELPDSLGELKPIVKIDIPRSLFVHKSPGGYFNRLGSSKRQLTPELLARLFQQRSQARIIRFDETTVADTSVESLNPVLWKRLTGSDNREESILTMRKLRILADDDNNRERATVGGLLMCSNNPDTWLPGALIEAVHYRGTVQDSNYQVDSRRITGPLDRQIMAAVSFVKDNMRIAAVKEPARTEIPQFSLRAVFEAIVNAVAHRDYSIHGSKVRLFIFSDRMELYSPGSLPNTVTIESLALRQATRNELITSILAKCPVGNENRQFRRQYLMDKRGEGVPVILNESKELSGKIPIYRLIDDTELMLTIYSAD